MADDGPQQGAAKQQDQKQNIAKAAECQQDRLMNLYTLGEIDAETYSLKNTAFGDRIAALTLKMEAVNRRREEKAEVAIKVFDLAQNVGE